MAKDHNKKTAHSSTPEYFLRDYPLVTKQDISKQIGLSVETLKRYRKDRWIEGIHWVRINCRTVRYNARLIADWMQNHQQPSIHIRAVEAYIRSLPSYDRERKRQILATFWASNQDIA